MVDIWRLFGCSAERSVSTARLDLQTERLVERSAERSVSTARLDLQTERLVERSAERSVSTAEFPSGCYTERSAERFQPLGFQVEPSGRNRALGRALGQPLGILTVATPSARRSAERSV